MSRPRTTREFLREWIAAPQAAHNYLFLALSALLVNTAVIAVQMDLILALVPAAIGLTAIVFRFPPFIYVFLATLCIAFTNPVISWALVRTTSDIRGSQFRISDVIVCTSTLVFMISYFRVVSFFDQALPQDSPGPPPSRGDASLLRPCSTVPEEELSKTLVAAMVFTVIGEIVWLVISGLEVDFHRTIPFVLAGSSDVSLHQADYGYAGLPGLGRFMLLFIVAAATVAPTILILTLWKWNRMSKETARAVLLDIGWVESRRELNRIENRRAKAMDKVRSELVLKTRAKRPWTLRSRKRGRRIVFIVSMAVLGFFVVLLAALGVAALIYMLLVKYGIFD